MKIKIAPSLVAALFFASSGQLLTQGILSVTPTRTVATTAGTGAVGYSGDGGMAASAALASPSGVAYDASSNLYLADAQSRRKHTPIT
jgi:hypothetical protein